MSLQNGSNGLHNTCARTRSRASSDVRPSGGPPESTFRWGVLACRMIVLLVWGITPLSWAYVAWSCLPQRIIDSLHLSTPPPSGWTRMLHLSLLAYTILEAAFSIYYRYLVHKAQAPQPPIHYDRAFLRQTLSRALEDGMKLEDLSSIKANPEPASKTGRPRRPTFSRANFSQLSFLDKSRALSKDDPRAVDWRETFRSWFLGVRWEELKRDNVLEWLAWSFFSMKLEDVVAEWEQEGRPALPDTVPDADVILAAEELPESTGGKLPFLYQGLFMLEARAGMPLPEGRAPGRSIRLHLDPVRSSSRPLAKYLVTGLFNVLLVRRTKRAGFQKIVDGGLEYLIRVPKEWKAGSEDENPVLFIHGLGMGLAQYASLVSYFEKHPGLQDRPLILLLQPHISMSLFHSQHLRPPNKLSTTQGLRALVAKWGFEDGITVVSHSNGTIVHGWLLKECPDLIKRSCFVDPVTFCLWEPHIAYNFLYRPPTTGIEHLMRYFVGSELGIALMLQRFFDWSSNITWCEEIPAVTDSHKTAFFLSEKDSILNAPRTARYLKDHGVRTVETGGNLRMLEGMAHGESLIAGGDALVDLMDWLTEKS